MPDPSPAARSRRCEPPAPRRPDTGRGATALGSAAAVAAAAAERHAAYGAFVGGYEWSHYVTLTFRSPQTPERAARAFEDEFVRRLTRRAQGPVSWFCAAERGPAGGAWHLHALVHGTGGLSCAEVARAWKRGQTRVLRYDPERGAALYITKAVLDAAAWYDVSLRRPPLRPVP